MNQTDVLFSRYIRARDGGICQAGALSERGQELKDCWGELECAHLISRRYKATRWDYQTPNAVTLCAGHHDYYTRHPLAWTAWRTEYLGALNMTRLWEKALNGEVPNAHAEKQIRAELARKLKATA